MTVNRINHLRITYDGQRWLIREAVSMQAAINAINHARVSGSVGGTDTKTDYTRDAWGELEKQPTVILADVVRLNSDNTERQPYQEAY